MKAEFAGNNPYFSKIPRDSLRLPPPRKSTELDVEMATSGDNNNSQRLTMTTASESFRSVKSDVDSVKSYSYREEKDCFDLESTVTMKVSATPNLTTTYHTPTPRHIVSFTPNQSGVYTKSNLSSCPDMDLTNSMKYYNEEKPVGIFIKNSPINRQFERNSNNYSNQYSRNIMPIQGKNNHNLVTLRSEQHNMEMDSQRSEFMERPSSERRLVSNSNGNLPLQSAYIRRQQENSNSMNLIRITSKSYNSSRKSDGSLNSTAMDYRDKNITNYGGKHVSNSNYQSWRSDNSLTTPLPSSTASIHRENERNQRNLIPLRMVSKDSRPSSELISLSSSQRSRSMSNSIVRVPSQSYQPVNKSNTTLLQPTVMSYHDRNMSNNVVRVQSKSYQSIHKTTQPVVMGHYDRNYHNTGGIIGIRGNHNNNNNANNSNNNQVRYTVRENTLPMQPLRRRLPVLSVNRKSYRSSMDTRNRQYLSDVVVETSPSYPTNSYTDGDDNDDDDDDTLWAEIDEQDKYVDSRPTSIHRRRSQRSSRLRKSQRVNCNNHSKSSNKLG